MPQPLKLETPFYQAEARWQREGDMAKSTLSIKTLTSVIPAPSVAVAAQATRALSSWLEAPLLLQSGGQLTAQEPTVSDDVEMQLMPTGDGQLSLVDRMYPREGNAKKRKAALEKVIRFFPNDPSTIFAAKTELACQFYLSGDYAKATEALGTLVKHQPAGVTASYFAFARYMHAFALQDHGQKEDALRIWQNLAEDSSLDTYRRSWSAVMAGEALAARKPIPEDAIRLLKQAFDSEGEASERALLALVPAMVRAGQTEALAELLANHPGISKLNQDGLEILEKIATSLQQPTSDLSAADALPAFRKARDLASDENRKKILTDLCASLESWASRGDSYAATREALNRAIEEYGKHYHNENDPGSDPLQIEKTLDATYGKDRESWMRLATAYFRKFPPTPAFSKIAWQYLWYVGNTDAAEPSEARKSMIGALFNPKSADSILFEKLSAATDLLPESDSNYAECQIVKARWLRDQKRPVESKSIYQKLHQSPHSNDYRFAITYGIAEIDEIQDRFKEAITGYLEHTDDRMSYAIAADALLRAGLLQVRNGERKAALETWELLQDVPPHVLEKSQLQSEITEALFLSRNQTATLAMWERTDVWWEKQVRPFFKSISMNPSIHPRIYLSDQGNLIDARGRSAIADRRRMDIHRDFAGVAMSARWLPSQLASLQQFVSLYFNPLYPSMAKPASEMIASGAEAINLGTPPVQEYNRRLHAALLLDIGNADKAIEVIENEYQEKPNRSEDHRERSAYIFSAAAGMNGKHLEEALKISRPYAYGEAASMSPAKWACVHADLLAKNNQTSEAVTFLKQKISQPEIKSSPEELVLVREKIAALSKNSGNTATFNLAVRTFLQKYKPSWYDYVGPADLHDPRVGNLEKIQELDVSVFELPERFRLRMMVALAEDLPLAIREIAFRSAVIDSFSWMKTWDDTFAVVSSVLDNPTLSYGLRETLFYLTAEAAAKDGQIDILDKLKVKPMFRSLDERYVSRTFPLLQSFAKAIPQGSEKLKECLIEFSRNEISAEELFIADMIYQAILFAGDLQTAESVRESFKIWKLSATATAESSKIRLKWVRLAAGAKDSILLDKKMLEAFSSELESLAKGAPANWQRRMDLSEMSDLESGLSESIRASILTTGFRKNATNPRQWLKNSSFWLGANEKRSRAAFIKSLPLILSCKNDAFVNIALGSTYLNRTQDFSEIDQAIAAHLKPGQRPAVDAMLELFKFYRQYRIGTAVPISHLLNQAQKTGSLASIHHYNLIEILIIENQLEELSQTLDLIDGDRLDSPAEIQCYIEALQLSQRDEELELIREKALRLASVKMMNSWAQPSSLAIIQACELATLCDRKDLLPAPWRKEMETAIADPTEQQLTRATLAALDEDWSKMLEILATPPDSGKPNTSWHWLTARALVGLGRPAEAKPHLLAVVESGTHDVRHFRDAARLLRELNL